jgi:formylglycine-generating enzyme required for sulfatase activity
VFTSLGLVDPAGSLARDLLLADGDYELTLEHRDFATSQQTIELRSGRPLALNPAQTPLPAALRISSTPQGAVVCINGSPVGTTPLTLDEQPARQDLLVEVSLTGHAPATRTLSLDPREIRVVDVGLLVAESRPTPPAIVAVDDASKKPTRRTRKPRGAPKEVLVSSASVNAPEPTAALPPQAVEPYAGPQPQQSWIVPGLSLAMQWIGPGEFLTAGPITQPGPAEAASFPNFVRVATGFWIGRFEVSQSQFEDVMEINPSAFAGTSPHAPVERVSWEDAATFCQRLTERERRSGRLPAGYAFALPCETEWEYACRAGSATHSPASLEQMAWFDRNSRKQTHAPGEKLPVPDPFGVSDSGPSRFIPHLKLQQPNNWGLYDMLGNVAEWCRAAQATAQTGSTHIVRGGSWRSSLSDLRFTSREPATPDTRRNDIGFRVVLTSTHLARVASAILSPVEVQLPRRAFGERAPRQAIDEVQAHVDAGGNSSRRHDRPFVDPANVRHDR